MRRSFVGMAILSIALSSPLTVLAEQNQPDSAKTVNDRIAQEIIDSLHKHKAKGELKGTELELIVNNGEVLLKGHVATEKQMALTVSVARDVKGVTKVVNDLQMQQETAATVEKREVSEPAEPAHPLEKLGGVANAMHRTNRTETAEQAATTQQASSESASDTQLRDRIAHQYRGMQADGRLRHFSINLAVEQGVVWVTGRVADEKQHGLALDVASHVRGVVQVVDQLKVVPPMANRVSYQTVPAVITPVSAPRAVQVQAAPTPVAPNQVAGNRPRPIARVAANYGQPVPAGLAGAPQPLPAHQASYGGQQAVRYDHAQVPNYAWPGYAAAPNYGALSYPRQYSPTAWPYIGPFYPYPQVPLGWRKVTLEWDDGFWMLNFSNRRRHHRH